MKLREYQQRTIDKLYEWWGEHDGVPIVSVPTGGGKSVIIAELVRGLWESWPEHRPRTVVLVPSKELAEQNAAKLRAMLPAGLRVGYYSASLKQKAPDADVIVATIGSIYKHAHLIGNIKCVVIDECHRVGTDGADTGQYRKFLSDLSALCEYRCVGYTATEFRGDGLWLTAGKHPFFDGIACKVHIRELLDAGHLAPLVLPPEGTSVGTRIDTDGIKTTSGDYNIGELSERVDQYITAAAGEAVVLAAERKKWIAFTPTVENAEHLAELLNGHGVTSAVVCGSTTAEERAASIEAFRAGRIRCLVTVLALATGFDVPDIDCILWLRPTKSPVLYCQGAGRGLRTAPGKTDCLWLDFSDTSERMGPVDTVRGRSKKATQDEEAKAPSKACPECGNEVHAAVMVCEACGYVWPEPEKQPRSVSMAPILSTPAAPKITRYEVSHASYRLHRKLGKPDSMRVEYWSGFAVVGTEWVCFEHDGYAKKKAVDWWEKRSDLPVPTISRDAVDAAEIHPPRKPVAIFVDESNKFPVIVKYEFQDATAEAE